MQRERTYSTEAIILRRRNYGEADRILTLFTPHLGKIRARAVGVRKPRSRKAGHLELFCRSNLFLARGRELDIITQAETIEPFAVLRDDLNRSASASYIAELLDRFAAEGIENREAYLCLSSALHALCEADEPKRVLLQYALLLVGTMGFRPELFTCVIGRETIRAEDQYFSPLLGGVICPQCKERARGHFAVTMPVLRLLRHFAKSTFPSTSVLSIRPETLEEADRVLQRYIHHLLEHPLRSRAFLQKVHEG
jgi:DNA repair protein RecO (recombination protein O)